MNPLPSCQLDSAVSELCEECDIVVSAPCAVFLAGEHSVVLGGPALVNILPRRVFVGIRGKQRRSDSDSAPRILRLRAFGRKNKSLESPEMDLLTEHEQLKHLASGFKTFYPAKLAEYIPTICDVVCDGYPARGCNFSGAFAAALALATLAVNGEIRDEVPWRGLSLKEQIQHKDFQNAFKLAMLVETISHEHPSGYGPVFGLLDFDDQPVLYFPYVSKSSLFFKGNPYKIKNFAVAPATTLGISHNVFHRSLGFLVIDTGVSRATKTAITQLRTITNSIASDWARVLNQVFWTQDIYSKKISAFTGESFIDGRYAPYRALAAVSVQVIDFLSQALADTHAGIERLLAQIRAISEIHIGLGLDWKEYRNIRHMLRDEIACEKVATKLTGGGGGGCIVVLGKKDNIESVTSRLESKFTVVFNSLSEDFERLGPILLKGLDHRQIKIETAEDMIVHISTFNGSAISYKRLGPEPTVSIIDKTLEFLYAQGNITHVFFISSQKDRVFDLYCLTGCEYKLVSIDSKEVPSRPLLGSMLAAIANNSQQRSTEAEEVVVSLSDLAKCYRNISRRYIEDQDFRERLEKIGKPSFNKVLFDICSAKTFKKNTYSFCFQQSVSICRIEPYFEK